MISKILPILILLQPLLLLSCSTIDAAWYSHPVSEYRYKNRQLEVTTARLELGGYSHEFWSLSGRYRTRSGPYCIPFYPGEAPILNYQTLRLNWRITPKVNRKGGGVIPRKSLELLTGGGKRIMPFSISTYRRLANGNRTMLNYFNPIPEEIKVSGTLEIEMWYSNIYYAKEKWYEIKPIVKVGGKGVQMPVLHFIPKRDHDYHPFIFPFAFAPVR